MTQERYEQRAFAVPPDATEVVLVRHGASMAAVPSEPFELLEGHGDPPLAPAGHEQALRLAERMRHEPLAALFTTPLTRTIETAAPLAERLGLRPTPIPALREVHLGDWEAGEFRIRAHQGDPVFVEMMREERWDLIPNAETNEAFGARVRDGFLEVAERAGTGVSVAAFVHGGVIGTLAAQATQSRPFAFMHADNCSITRIVVFGDGRWLLRSFNDTAHLA